MEEFGKISLCFFSYKKGHYQIHDNGPVPGCPDYFFLIFVACFKTLASPALP